MGILLAFAPFIAFAVVDRLIGPAYDAGFPSASWHLLGLQTYPVVSGKRHFRRMQGDS
jgi:hypothetical protein